MTLAYRSPDVYVDGTPWHLAVYGRRMVYRFRSNRGYQPVTQWPGRLPKGMWKVFAKYRKHADEARALTMGSVP